MRSTPKDPLASPEVCPRLGHSAPRPRAKPDRHQDFVFLSIYCLPKRDRIKMKLMKDYQTQGAPAIVTGYAGPTASSSSELEDTLRITEREEMSAHRYRFIYHGSKVSSEL